MMSDQSPPAPRALLTQLRERWRAHGIAGFTRDEPPAWPSGEPQAPEAMELAGYQALCAARPGWAVLSLLSAQRGYRDRGASADAAWAGEVEAALRRAHFPPYQTDEALISDVGAWLRARIAALLATLQAEVTASERGQPDPPLPDAGASEDRLHRWLLRRRSSEEAARPLRVGQLAARLGLSGLDERWLLALLSLERDLAAQHLLGKWLGSEGRVSAGLLARLLADDREVETALLARLDLGGPLLRLRLLYLNPPAERPCCGVRHCLVELDECVPAFIEGRPRWPAGLDAVVQPHAPAPLPLQHMLEARVAVLQQAFARLSALGRPAALAVCGPSLESTRMLVLGLCHRLRRPLLQVAAHWLFSDPARLDGVLRLVLREARLRDALVFIDGQRDWEAGKGAQEALAVISRCQASHPAPLLFDAAVEGDPLLRRECRDLFEVRLPLPDLDDQVILWQQALAAAGLGALPEVEIRQGILDTALRIEDIQRAVALARNQAWLSGEPGRSLSVPSAALRAAVSSDVQRGLSGIAERISTTLTWDDVVLEEEVLSSLSEIILYARHRQRVFEDWGFGRTLPYGRANSSLFTGPPGTGKTMVAGLIARELGMDLFRVDVSQIVSKYIGETEKNLSRVFEEASRSNAVLLFDEADSLFAKRTQVQSSHDRYSNLEVNYLLQRIESFAGVTILTSNFVDNIDPAFLRRIKFRVNFPFPEEEERALLWRVMLPKAAALDPDVDFERLGRLFELAGGSIKNAAIRAAFHAAEHETPITQALLEDAGVAEYRALGKLLRVHEGRPLLPNE